MRWAGSIAERTRAIVNAAADMVFALQRQVRRDAATVRRRDAELTARPFNRPTGRLLAKQPEPLDRQGDAG